MQRCYALLLDGGFLKRQLGTSKAPMTVAEVAGFVAKAAAHDALKDLRLHRVYFYDAKPLEGSAENPLDGGALDFSSSPASARNKSLHSAISKEPFFSLRYGELHCDGWRLKAKVLFKAKKTPGVPLALAASDIEPNIRQKGVDMRIGLDIASLTLKEHADVIVLVTADSDFVPAMKFARREGAQLYLITLGHGIKVGMREHADLVIENLA